MTARERLKFGRLRTKNKPALNSIVAHVDQIGPNFLRGWAADRDQPGKALHLKFFLDDHLVAEGEASSQRDDLRQAGYGEGRHAFQFPVPTKAVFCAERLVVKTLKEGSEVVILDLKLQYNVPRAAVIHLDASDLIEFLSSHREISGIQRVQAGYLLGLAETGAGPANCRICTRLRSFNWYYEISRASLAALLKDSGDLGAVSEGQWLRRIQSFKDGLTRRALIRPGDVVFTLGAPWGLDFHNELTQCIKRHYKAQYYQIFYDLIPISTPEVVPAPLIAPFARAMAAMSKHADHIFSISEYAKQDLSRALARFEYPLPPISIVPMGGTITDADGAVGSGWKPGNIVEGPFVLCVGTLEPRKNHLLLLNVWRQLNAKYGRDIPTLVLVGRVGWYMEDFMRMLKVTNYANGTIVHLTGISNAELDALYSGCLFTIFPSFSEGWGLPITESMAHGKVCVCSNSTSMPEAGGDYAVYIDPFNTSAAFDICDKLIHDVETLKACEAKLSGFIPMTWQAAARGMRQEIEKTFLRGPSQSRQTNIELSRVYKLYKLEDESSSLSAIEILQSYLHQEDGADLLAGWKWFDVDVACVWACGPSAELNFVLPTEAPAELVAYVEVVCFPTYLGASCGVFVDGVSAGVFKLASDVLCVAVPLSYKKRPIAVVFEVEEYRVPSGPDLRLISIGLRTVTLLDLNDFEGRIRFLERSAAKGISL